MTTQQRTTSTDLPTLLAGGVRASAGARVAAGAIDLVSVAVVGLPLWLGAGRGVDALVAVGATALTGALVLGYRVSALTGRTLGRLALGLRTVDLFTGLPVGLRRPLAERWTGAVVLDLRLGRDPTLGVAADVAAARAALPPTSTIARWVPTAPPAPRGGHR